MSYRLAAAAFFGILSLPGLVHAQETPEPRRLLFNQVEVGSCDATYVAALVKLLPDGRCVTAWWFTVEEFKFRDGKFDLRLEVKSKFPIDLELYSWDRSAEIISEGRARGAKRVGPQLLGPPKGGRSNVRRADAVLKQPGDYLLVVISAEANPEGTYRLGLGIPADMPEALEPLPDIKAREPIRSVPTEKYFRNLTLSASEARFGEHVALTPRFADLPGSCEWQFAGADVGGLLPPGLKLRPNSNVIEGTPRRLGTWNFTYALRKLKCKNDPTDYGDRQASISFTVLP